MHRVVINIPDNKFNSFMELLKNIGINKIEELTPEQVKYADGLNQALDEVQEHLEGKKYLSDAKDFLEEL